MLPWIAFLRLKIRMFSYEKDTSHKTHRFIHLASKHRTGEFDERVCLGGLSWTKGKIPSDILKLYKKQLTLKKQ